MLKVFLDKHPELGRVLIPGCGSGDRIEAFSSGGWDMIGIDFSAVAVARARRLLGPLADKVYKGDFYAGRSRATRIGEQDVFEGFRT